MRTLGLLLVLTLVFTACASSSKEADPASPEPGEAMSGHVVAYLKAVSASSGIVGYVKVWEYTRQEKGGTYRQFHVHGLDFKKRGFLNEDGTGTKYVYLPAEVARVKGKTIEMVAVSAQPLEWNVAKILDAPTDLKIVEARPEDLK